MEKASRRHGGEIGTMERKASGSVRWRGRRSGDKAGRGMVEMAGGMRGGARSQAHGAAVSFFLETTVAEVSG
jgi:hypothetical protein